MRRISIIFIGLGLISFLSGPSWAQRGIAGHSFVLDDGSGNTLTLLYPNIPPVIGNSIYNFLPGGGSSIPGGTVNGQTLWWNNTTLLWTADNSLTNTGSAVGIGTSTPSWPLDLQHTFTQTTGEIASNVYMKLQPTAAMSSQNFAIEASTDIESANAVTGPVASFLGQTTLGAGATSAASWIIGTAGSALSANTSQAVTEADGLYGQIWNQSTGTIGTANALKVSLLNGGTLTNASGIYVPAPFNSGTITNLYGLYMQQQTSATNIWPIFLSDGTLSGSIFDVAGSGNVGIGTSTPNYPLDLEHTFTQTSNPLYYGSSSLIQIQPSAASGARYVATSGVSDAENANSISGVVEGVRGQASAGEYGTSSQPLYIISGVVGSGEDNTTETIPEADGVWGQMINYSTGTISNANAMKAYVVNESSGTITNARGLYVEFPYNTGTITNLYGLYMDAQTAGTNNWPIFLSDGTATGSIFDVTGSGDVGIGTSTPSWPLDIEQTFTETSLEAGSNVLVKIQPSAASSAHYYGFASQADAENTNSMSGAVVEGVRGAASLGELGTSSQPVSTLVGTVGSAENSSGQTVTESDGIAGQILNTSTATLTTANAMKAALFNESSGTLTNARGLYVQAPLNSGTITNLYGLYMDAQTSGTNNWPIFLSDGTASGSIFAITGSGDVGIGTGSSTPTANLQVAGTVSIGSSSDASLTHISNIAQYYVTYSFPSTPAQTSSSVTILMPGTAPSLTDGTDDVIMEVPNAVMTSVTGTFNAWVADATHITIQFNNYSSSTQTPPASTTYHFTVITH
jgi:hypothetical protein